MLMLNIVKLPLDMLSKSLIHSPWSRQPAHWQGFTAHSFACSSYPIKAGDKILVHAAAGGVGSLIVQIAKNAGKLIINSIFCHFTRHAQAPKSRIMHSSKLSPLTARC